jgi:hypothetical protein
MFLPVPENLEKMKEISCRVVYPYSLYVDRAFSTVLGRDTHPSPNAHNAAFKICEIVFIFILASV